MLENDNDDLHEQIACGDDRVDMLEQEAEELQAQLEQAREDLVRHEAEFRTQTRELNNVKVRSAIFSIVGEL